MSKYYRKFVSETVYLWNDFDEVFVKVVPGKGFYIKRPGSDEYKVDPGSDIVTNAMSGKREITKQQYDNGKL